MTVTNGYQHQWPEERVTEELNKTLSRAYRAFSETVERDNVSYTGRRP